MYHGNRHREPISGWDKAIREKIRGELATDDLSKILYSTDASVYREMPLGVVYPMEEQDVSDLVAIASSYQLPLIPRTAGTSLGGQCVGSALVVDVSRHLNKILELDVGNRRITVEPGVIRDDLNRYLAPYGLFFGPNTSTANRCMIGGMVGNNSCGSTSIVYGSTRDHVHSLTGYLSDGSLVTFGPTDQGQIDLLANQQNLCGSLYRHLISRLGEPGVQENIREWYPKTSIRRRNNGYAIDTLIRQQPFNAEGEPLNLAKMICGSEGTLMLITRIVLDLDELPPVHGAMVCVHFADLLESMEAVVPIMQLQPFACELMDKAILDCTRGSRAQEKNRFFLEGDPQAVLMVEFRARTEQAALQKAEELIRSLKEKEFGYAYPQVTGKAINRVMSLRQAGLGILSNIPGKKKAVACIEDTAVAITDLKAYIRDFSELMASFHQQSIYYAHAGDGEIHLRPVLDLKDAGDVAHFRAISEASARLVKHYRGSLSGEHGIGRVRAEFLPESIGPDNYAILQEIKQVWDPQNLFNPGKIVDAPPMDAALRYAVDQPEPLIPTAFEFGSINGLLGEAERCNGSGDCRKSTAAGGTMCPSYQATLDEKHTTRARANALREYMTRSANQKSPLDHPELLDVLDLCLSCKGCTGECPSNVDMAALKSEFLYQYYRTNQRPRGHFFILHNDQLAKWGGLAPGMANWATKHPVIGKIIRSFMDIAPQRSLPAIAPKTWWSLYHRAAGLLNTGVQKTAVYFLIDEFTNYFEPQIGMKAMHLLHRLGFPVFAMSPVSTGRAAISKGYLGHARDLAEKQIRRYQPFLREEMVLLGVEPSALLSFRDEYPRLLRGEDQDVARRLAMKAWLVEEFLVQAWHGGLIDTKLFDQNPRRLLVHGHCHQKALVGIEPTLEALSIPSGHHVELIPSGCCGMAGSFGYEPDHYSTSMKVGELVLFPALRKARQDQIIVASGTSCRHQIRDGVDGRAFHPVEILSNALKST
ncbi:MAG TPA: FAD-linked oxidase C-terminal domain-containing protein [Saprospiraceae bacterium]|nr:FAD-linked oxidase C-terminal domain-containing protein [Saprospiraceae bacterium]